VAPYLRGLTRNELEEMVKSRGVGEVGGSGKDGNVTKADLVGVLGAHMKSYPSHVRVRAEIFYHNGIIPDGQGLEWKQFEERVISLGAWDQIKQDTKPDQFIFLETVNMVEGGGKGEGDADES